MSPTQDRTGIHLLIHRLPVVVVLAFALAGCRDAKPAASTYPLRDPPAAYPDRPAAATAAGASAAPAGGTASPASAPAAVGGAADNVIWERLGAWSGKGNIQTESFTGATGSFRIKWEARAVPGRPEGRLVLTIHSAISGRPLQVAVDQKGPGADTAFVNEDPRVFFAVVESHDIEWSFSVEEAVGTRRVPAK